MLQPRLCFTCGSDWPGVLRRSDDDEREPHETAFTLWFDKARRRTPDNWDEFPSE
jgi:hypothetical protein